MKKKKLLLTIVTPEKTVFAAHPADFVAIPALEGEVGVLPGHTAMVVQLREGILRYFSGQEKNAFAVLSGFAQVSGDKVLVLAEAAELATEINEERARQAWRKAKDIITMKGDQMDLDEAQAALKRAAVRMKLAEFRRKHK